jgi:hypothetical protein
LSTLFLALPSALRGVLAGVEMAQVWNREQRIMTKRTRRNHGAVFKAKVAIRPRGRARLDRFFVDRMPVRGVESDEMYNEFEKE